MPRVLRASLSSVLRLLGFSPLVPREGRDRFGLPRGRDGPISRRSTGLIRSLWAAWARLCDNSHSGAYRESDTHESSLEAAGSETPTYRPGRHRRLSRVFLVIPLRLGVGLLSPGAHFLTPTAGGLLRLFQSPLRVLWARSTCPPRLPAQPPMVPGHDRWLGGEAGWAGGAPKAPAFESGAQARREVGWVGGAENPRTRILSRA